MITFDEVSLRRGQKLLLDKASTTIHKQERIGLIGRNGSGKSSLFELLLYKLESSDGNIKQPKALRIAHLSQETPALSQSAQEYVLDGDKNYRSLQAKMAQECDPYQLSKLQEAFELNDGYRKPSLACLLLHGLGFKSEEFDKPVKDFSGGWRMRLNLAQALLCPSDLLLLDEPTNHLDLDAIVFLEKFLKRSTNTLIIISHDKSFLNNLCSTIIQIEHKKLERYQGNYDDFERIKAEKIKLQQKLYQKQQTQIAHLMKFVDKFRAKASKAKQAQSRLKAIEKIEQIALAHAESTIQFEFKPTKPCQQIVANFEQANIGYQTGSPLIENLNLQIHYGDRIAILGPNGTGKSTLLKTLAQRQPLLSGSYSLTNHNLTISYFEQHQLEQLTLTNSLLQELQSHYPSHSEQSLRNHLGQFGFDGDTVNQPIAPLSGGEKTRLVLAILVLKAPNLLILDEPTNHLDLDMRASLELALQSYQGTLILISHDRELLASCVDSFYVLANNKLAEFTGDLADYEALAIQQTTQKEQKPKTTSQPNSNTTIDRKTRNRIKKIETLLQEQLDKLKQNEQILCQDSTYQDQNLLQKCLEQQQQLQQQIEELEMEWLELQQ